MSAIASALFLQLNTGDTSATTVGTRPQLVWSTAYPLTFVSELRSLDNRCLRSDGLVAAPPRTLEVATLNSTELLLKSPIQIHVEAAGSEFIAYSVDLEEFAVGRDEQSAIEELKASIVDAYFILKEEQDALGPIQQVHWNYLKQIVVEA